MATHPREEAQGLDETLQQTKNRGPGTPSAVGVGAASSGVARSPLKTDEVVQTENVRHPTATNHELLPHLLARPWLRCCRCCEAWSILRRGWPCGYEQEFGLE